ncbi:tRNA lysidine(34) synthetase TilS [candidate division KSB1 bacterium]|nr:MAG: tRNA lysidine(34) synthetase TilS [candidate division KSB1 bacterium]
MNSVIERTWHDRVREHLLHWIGPEDRILIAVSGGADSMGMLALIAAYFQWSRDRIVVGHIHHGIRPDACLDEELIRTECGRRGLRCESTKVDTPTFARERRLSIEVAARTLRYKSLESIAERNGCKWILTGHTLDDSAETVWMRMTSGAPWYEWTGIPEKRGRILRPLLTVVRSELRGWIDEAGIPFRDDSTNQDLHHLRNQIRLELLQKQEVLYRKTIQSLAESGANLLQLIETVRKLVRLRYLKAFGEWQDDRICLEIDGIFRYFKGLNFLPVEVAWAEMTGEKEARFASVFRKQIPQFLAGTSPQAKLRLPNQITILRRGGKIWLHRENLSMTSVSVSLGTWEVPQRKGILSLERVRLVSDNPADGFRISLKFAAAPLQLRRWQPGDRLKPRGRPTKKISALLAEKKLDPIERERTVVLADEAGPLVVPGIAVAQRAEPGASDREAILVRWKTEHGTHRHDDC